MKIRRVDSVVTEDSEGAPIQSRTAVIDFDERDIEDEATGTMFRCPKSDIVILAFACSVEDAEELLRDRRNHVERYGHTSVTSRLLRRLASAYACEE